MYQFTKEIPKKEGFYRTRIKMKEYEVHNVANIYSDFPYLIIQFADCFVGKQTLRQCIKNNPNLEFALIPKPEEKDE